MRCVAGVSGWGRGFGGHLGVIWGLLGEILGRFCPFSERFGSTQVNLGSFRRDLGQLGLILPFLEEIWVNLGQFCPFLERFGSTWVIWALLGEIWVNVGQFGPFSERFWVNFALSRRNLGQLRSIWALPGKTWVYLG